jgi:alcohol dehydrogenase class IV
LNQSKFNIPFNLSLPTEVRFVPQGAQNVLEEVKSKGIKNVAVIVDSGTKEQPLIKNFLNDLDGILKVDRLVSYNGGEPTYNLLEQIRSQFKDDSPSGVFAIGGGSTMDIGKAIAVLLANSGPAIKYRGFNDPTLESLPIVTVPTVAGTGSEITPNASFVDDKEMRKLGINGECVRPTYAIIDPSFSFSCPKDALLSAAVDSIVHATEAYVAKKSNLISRFFAKEAFTLVCSNLEKLVGEEKSLETRCQLAIGSLFAALAMIHSGTGPAAAMSYPMGVRYLVPHGFAGAIFLPFVAQITNEADCFVHDELIKEIAPDGFNYSDYVGALWDRIQIPQDIEKMGLSTDQDEMFINETLELSGALEQHPTPFGKKEIKEVLQRIREVEI